MLLQPIRLEVKNFCQFRTADLTFPRGITGVFGPVGSGKTNLFDTALFFALFGKTADDTPIQQLMNWHTKEKDGFVRLLFRYGDHEFFLTRHVNALKRSLVRTGSDRPITAAAEIQQTMTDMLGMELTTCRETVFIGQGRFSEVITATHSDRMTYFQKLLGLDRAENFRNLLLEAVGRLPVAVDRTVECGQLREDLKTLQSQVTALQEEQDRMQAWLSENADSRAEADTLLKLPRLFEVEGLKRAAREEEERTALACATFGDAERPAEVERVLPPDPKVRRLAERLRTEKPLLGERLERVLHDLGSLGTPPEVGSAERETQQLQEATARLSELTPLKKLAETGVCPTCQHPYELPQDRQEILQEYRRLQEELQKATKTCQAAVDRVTEQTKQLSAWTARQQSLQQEKQRTETSLTTLDQLSKGVDPQKIDEQDAAAAAYSAYLETLRTFEAKLAVLVEAHRLAAARLEEAEKLSGLDDAEREEWTQFVLEYDRHFREASERKFEIQRLQTQMSERQNQLQAYETETAEARKIAGVRKLFEDTRGLFHKDVLPRRVMRRTIEEINIHMNAYLQRFQVGFSAWLDENFDFIYEQGTSGARSCARLSGGQKVLLALAFRLASARVISSTFPVLVLDEPTIHLDDTTIEFMADVLTDLQEHTAKNMTLFVLTHEERLQRAMQRTIHVEEFSRTV